jgi:asparagine synthase (glutamine-hydrolysing)
MSFWKLYLSHGKWRSAPYGGPDGSCHLKGQAYLDEKPIDATKLASALHDRHSTEDLVATLKRLNGFYAWVTEGSGVLMAGVDHVRSYPLFYGQKNGLLLLSDDADWVRQRVGDTEMDEVAREEFQLTGYVTGQETLFPNVKQLQAGECLIAMETPQGLYLQTFRYYLFEHIEPEHYDEATLREELDVLAMQSIQRLLDFAGGRQIVVPLSGGFDSRLIVALLKRAGHTNVLTFTYGVKGNRESAYSQRVAEALGFRWHFEEYTQELWRNAWQSDDRWEYQQWSSGWSSLPHIQDWLAVRLMKQCGMLPTDCVFAPGHSGDFVAGSHIPQDAFTKPSFRTRDVYRKILNEHYLLAPMKTSKKQESFWTRRIETRLQRKDVSSASEYADAVECWDWQERQAKFICNSVRVYESFGYGWWMPLWDARFMQFWEKIPLILRRQRKWYISYAQSQKIGHATLPNAAANKQVAALKQVLYRISPSVVDIIKILRRSVRRELSRNLLMPEARLGKQISIRLSNQKYLVNGIESYRFLEEAIARG